MPDTHFGFREIPLDDKQALVDDVFHKVARRYDLMNDLMSAGLHRAWKDALVTAINPPRTERDFARSTSREAPATSRSARLRRAAGTRATVADINAEMLGVGRGACAQALDDVVTFVDANAEALPFPTGASMRYRSRSASATCRCIDIALGDAPCCARQAFPVPGILNVDVPGLDALYELYSFNVVPALGRVVAGDAEPYRYLVESIRRFPRPNAFADMMRAAGFARVSHRVMSGGIVALHSGWRL
jgi:demethylmenaquinone methyltransferase/2-methoxy-6-polyprenyl-1,4-benzoquinol methylase